MLLHKLINIWEAIIHGFWVRFSQLLYHALGYFYTNVLKGKLWKGWFYKSLAHKYFNCSSEELKDVSPEVKHMNQALALMKFTSSVNGQELQFTYPYLPVSWQ